MDDEELGKKEGAMVLVPLAEKIFSSTLVGPALSQMGLIIGNHARLFRIKNLIAINEKLDGILDERNLERGDLKNISLSVGLPLLEKASYQEDDFLQEKWANLIASSMGNGGNDSSDISLDNTYVEILHQLSRLDCEVLEYIAENGVRGKNADNGGLRIEPLDPLELRNVFPEKPVHVSLEKLVALGCAYRVMRAPLSFGEGGDGYGPLAQDLMVTLIGLNLYISASGRDPKWKDVRIQDAEEK